MTKYVCALMKVMPDDTDLNLDDLTDKISAVLPEGCNLLGKDEEPIFGDLVALKLQISIPHDMEGTDAVEQAIAGVEGVQRVEVEAVSML